jgi:UDP-N-acetyl-D-mannosaminuronic acid dehydrogenase
MGAAAHDIDHLRGSSGACRSSIRLHVEVVRQLYAAFVAGKIFVTDATTAEMVKLMENTYRDVNIALANEFALVAEQVGIDVWEAITLANRHPRVQILQPRPGVGGHCIAVDPWFIAQAAPHVSPLIQAARRLNNAMPVHVLELVKRAIAGLHNPVIACLGLAYKANVDDTRESPALEVLRLLAKEGYEIRACDPHVPDLHGLGVPLLSLGESLTGADCAIILTDHLQFRNLDDSMLRLMRHPIVVDTRNALGDRTQKGNQLTLLTLGAMH